jgi:hypothetical protein
MEAFSSITIKRIHQQDRDRIICLNIAVIMFKDKMLVMFFNFAAFSMCSNQLEAIFVVVEVEKMTAIEHRLVGEIVRHVKAHFTSTRPKQTIHQDHNQIYT